MAPQPAGASSDEPAGAAWTAAIDAYLDTENPTLLVATMHRTPDAVRKEARAAHEAWRASARVSRSMPGAREARRQALRRLEGSALAPLEVLLALSALRSNTTEWDAFEDVALAAWEGLHDAGRLHFDTTDGDRAARDRERARQVRFRSWWRLAYLQYLLNVTRLRDFNRELSTFDVDEGGEPRLRAEYAFLRGLANETVARLSDQRLPATRMEVPTAGVRSGAVFNALSAAHAWYRRALRAVPSHAETRLHLGRVLLEQGKAAESLTMLTPLATDRCQGVECATAWLFIGEAHESRGDVRRAGQAYAHASSVLGVRQSALLALMHLAVRRGDVNASLAITSQLSATSPLSALAPPDAWSVYVGGRRLDGEAVLSPLRESRMR